ncbi:unnamed protein product [Umbelopsis ramanniana]
MPIWMLNRIQVWNNALSNWGSPIYSTGMMLETTVSLQHPTALPPSFSQLQFGFNQSSEVRPLTWQLPQAEADLTATMPVSAPPEPPKSAQKQSTKKGQKKPLKPKPSTSASSSTAIFTRPFEISTGMQTSPVEDDSEIDEDTIHQIFNDPAFPSLISHIEEILQKLYPS